MAARNRKRKAKGHAVRAAPQPPAFTTELLDLNHDCLIEIASRLSLHDLSQFASTCSRLQDIARLTFVLTPENKELTIQYHADLSNMHPYYIADLLTNDPVLRGSECIRLLEAFNSRMSQYLRHFGHLVEKLHFETWAVHCGQRFHWTNEPLFNEVLQWCDPEKLSSVTLGGMHWTPDLAARAESFFGKLNKIVIYICMSTDLILPKCINVTSLDVDDITDTRSVYLPKLTKLKVTHRLRSSCPIYKSFVRSFMEKFIARNPQIEELDISAILDFKLTSLNRFVGLKKVNLNVCDVELRASSTELAAFLNMRLEELHINAEHSRRRSNAEETDVLWKFIQSVSEGDSQHTLNSLQILGDFQIVAKKSPLCRGSKD